ncbi:MAG: NTP transferase domain-containing protein, partial [Pseudomonadota bacterium]
MRVFGAVLAAGFSRRFGALNKLMADLGGKPLLRWAAAALAEADLSARAAVMGAGAEGTEAALDGLGLT